MTSVFPYLSREVKGLWRGCFGSWMAPGDDLGEDYSGWPLRDRLELLAFDARLAGVPPTLLEALWEAIDLLSGQSEPCR
jgi:hypothetical protein